MGLTNYKVLNINSSNFVEEQHDIESSINFDVYLNTKIWNDAISKDLLSKSRMDTLLNTPSKIDIDYKSGKFDIQLSVDAWNRINEIDEQIIAEDVIRNFKDRVKQLYE